MSHRIQLPCGEKIEPLSVLLWRTMPDAEDYHQQVSFLGRLVDVIRQVAEASQVPAVFLGGHIQITQHSLSESGFAGL